MASFGKIDKFNRDVEDWPHYMERLKQYFIANDIEDDVKKWAILLSACGTSFYGMIRTLVSPEKTEIC